MLKDMIIDEGMREVLDALATILSEVLSTWDILTWNILISINH